MPSGLGEDQTTFVTLSEWEKPIRNIGHSAWIILNYLNVIKIWHFIIPLPNVHTQPHTCSMNCIGTSQVLVVQCYHSTQLRVQLVQSELLQTTHSRGKYLADWGCLEHKIEPLVLLSSPRLQRRELDFPSGLSVSAWSTLWVPGQVEICHCSGNDGLQCFPDRHHVSVPFQRHWPSLECLHC